MAIFLSKVISDLLCQGVDMKNVALVTPGRRAALFIKKEISQQLPYSTFAPQIYTIEDLTSHIARIEQVDQVALLFEFYHVYTQVVTEKDAESFDVFARWAETLLGDFNEIDRYRLDADDVFENLQAIEKIENWDPSDELSPMMRSHKNFWHLAQKLYHGLWRHLLSKGLGYQGMVFRRAADNIKMSAKVFEEDITWVFVGFNALNDSEIAIMQWFVKHKNARLYYDCDKYYLEDPKHEAGIFLRKLRATPLLGKNFSWIDQSLRTHKKLQTIGIPKQVGQAKVACDILHTLLQDGHSLEDTAMVLADEQLLIPTLSSLPKDLPCVNVTMGYPLSGLSASGFVDSIISLHSSPVKLSIDGFYHRNVISLLCQSVSAVLLTYKGVNYASKIIHHILSNDIVVVHPHNLPKDLPDIIVQRLNKLLSEVIHSPKELCAHIISLVDNIRSMDIDIDDITREYFFKLSSVLDTLYAYMCRYPYISNMSTFGSFFRRMSASEKLSFYGEPLEGLQLMGILETRLLDFKNVIITSLNEGSLPAGKTDNSFIPYDVKRHFDLPTYKEKDAIYAYHFYRLIQRAENIYLIYNSDQTNLGQGEPSRFLAQLRYEFADVWDIQSLNAQLPPTRIQESNIVVQKTEFTIQKIRQILENGLSPSSLNAYLKNPMDFYYHKILGIREAAQVEETVQTNTMGTIIHSVLETLYKPFEGRELSAKDISEALSKSDNSTKDAFDQQMGEKNYSSGRNFLIFEATKRLVSNFLRQELFLLKKGHKIRILALELKLDRVIQIEGIEQPVKLIGTVDRIDTFDGELRIIDYKSGIVKPSDTTLNDFEDIHTSTPDAPYTKDKAFQLMFYALLYAKDHKIGTFNSGVISTRNPKDGLICFRFSTQTRAKYRTDITVEDLDGFVERLGMIINELLDRTKPFVEAGNVYYDI